MSIKRYIVSKIGHVRDYKCSILIISTKLSFFFFFEKIYFFDSYLVHTYFISATELPTNTFENTQKLTKKKKKKRENFHFVSILLIHRSFVWYCIKYKGGWSFRQIMYISAHCTVFFPNSRYVENALYKLRSWLLDQTPYLRYTHAS